MTDKTRDPEKIQDLYRQLFVELGVENEMTNPELSARAMAEIDLEFTSGYGDPAAVIKKNFDICFPASKRAQRQLIVEIKNIQWFSRCEHHASPMFGLMHYFYIPDERFIGLSKPARTIEFFGKRYQMQEEMTMEVSDFLWNEIKPVAHVVIIEGVHMCTVMRGAKSPRTVTQTRVQRCNEEIYAEQLGEGALYHMIKDLLNHSATGRTSEVSFL